MTAEVGYGLVPVDAFERQYREAVGRICTNLAACADRVDRVQWRDRDQDQVRRRTEDEDRVGKCIAAGY